MSVMKPKSCIVKASAFFLAALLIPLGLGATETKVLNSREEQAVIRTIQRFFDAMADRDPEGALEVMIPEGRFFSLREEEGGTLIRTFTNQEFADGLETQAPDILERFWEPEIRIHGGIATVWAPYDFYLDGELHHCGIDAFDLVNDGGGWKITGGVYTVETSGCPESPLGPPAIDLQ